MSDKLVVTITGSNGVSRVFQEVTRDAKTMGTGVEEASRQSARGLDDFKNKAVAVGTIAGTLVGVSSALGQAFNSQEQQVAALDRAYGDSAESMRAFAERIQDTTTFSNDAARQAELTAATLVRNYGFTADEIQRVLQISADLAATSGISLTDATERVTAALRGEAESAERLGLTMNQQAIDRQGLTLTMSNEAAAHFRLNALIEQSAFADGAAAEKARTHAGEARQLANELQDLAQSAGGLIGPIGAYTSVLGNLALAAPAVGAGFGKVSGALKEIGATSAIASVGLGPAGLAVAALAAGAGILYLTMQSERYVSAADSAIAATTNLDNVLAIMAAQSGPQSALVIEDLNRQIDDFLAVSGPAYDKFQDLVALGNALSYQPLDLTLADEVSGILQAFPLLTEADLRLMDANHDLFLSFQEVQDAIAGIGPAADLALRGLDDTQIKQFQADVATILTLPSVDVVKASAAIKDLISQFQSGEITSGEFIAALDNLTVNYKNLIISTTAATKATEANTKAVDANAAAYARAEQMLGKATGLSVSAAFALAAQYADTVREGEFFTETLERSWRLTHGAAVATADWTDALEAEATKAAEAQQALDAYAKALGQLPAIADTHAAGFAKNAGAAGTALGDAFRVAIGNTNQIGQQAQQTADWATELVNVAGQTGKIDDLLARGVISQQEYNAAQAAGTQIFAANARIQDDILKIQTDQAPLLARLTDEQARYLDHLASLPPEQQLVRLGYMDTAESAKAMEIAQLAAAAAAGELGAAGKASAEQMIVGAAEADPVLKAMLEDMGLISVGADGTITVNFDAVTGADSAMNKLIDKLSTFIDLIAEVLGIDIDSSAADVATTAIEGAQRALETLDASSASPTVTADTGGFFTQMDEVRATMADIDGLSAQLNVNTNYTTTGNGMQVSGNSNNSIGGPGRLGGVVGYADGGVVARMAEAGAELLHFANGGLGLALTDGLYNVPRGTFVDTAPATKAKLAGFGGITIEHAELHFHGFQTSEQVRRQLSEFAHGGARS